MCFKLFFELSVPQNYLKPHFLAARTDKKSKHDKIMALPDRKTP